MPNTPSTTTYDAHRHLGRLPAYPFYGGPPVNPDTTARDQIADLLADLDRGHDILLRQALAHLGFPI